MAFNLNEWKGRYPNIEDGLLIQWLSEMTLADIPLDSQQAFIKEKHKAYMNGKPSDAPKAIAPEVVQNEPEEDPEEVDEQIEDDESLEDEETTEDEEPDEETSTPAEYTTETPSFKEEVQNFQPKERFESTDPKIPFDNPDLSALDVPDQGENEPEPDPEPMPRPRPRFRAPLLRPEMITRTVTYDEYNEIIQPFKPLLDDIKKDSGTLNKFAAQIDGRYMPPYMQIKSYIINHPIKDPNNTQVIVNVVSETNAKNVERRYVVLTQANDITRTLAEQGWFEEALWNYDVLIDKMFEERRAMVSLIFILENYCEQKQVSPFELSIPKKLLMDSVEQSFQAIKTLITDNVIREMSTLRTDLQGEMGDVGGMVEKNMTRFDSNIQEAITKVMWKVKTDVENTNLEDIKRSLLFVLNKRSASNSLGGTATALMSLLCDDLERKLLEQGFKLDNVKEYQKYTIEDLRNRLGYKSANIIMRTIPKLTSRKLIRMYENKLISL